MIIPKALLKICSTDSTRHTISHIYVDIEASAAIATDGHKLVYYPIQVEEGADEVSGYVPKDAILAAATNKPFCGLIIHREKDTLVPGKGTFPNPYAGDDPAPKYPDWEPIIAYPEEHYHHITFNARFLADIADVLSPTSHAVSVHYNPDNEFVPLHVTSGETGAIAMLMPVRRK